MGDKSFLVLDVGTEAVKAGILKESEAGYDLMETALHYYDKFGVFDSRNWAKDVIKKTIMEATDGLRMKVKSVFLLLPPDVLKAKISSQSWERKNHKKNIGKREEKEIKDEILRNNKKEISESFFQEAGILPSELDFLEQVFLEIKIDGYQVPSLSNYQGRKVEVAVLSLFLAKGYLNDFRQILEELGLEVLKIIHPACNATKLFEGRDGIFIDVGGKITQIFVVKNGKLQDAADFPLGGEDFSKALCQKLGLSEQRARLMKERYSKGEMSEKTREEFNEIFSEVAEEWLHNLELKLRRCRGFLPFDIFLFGGGSQLPEIQEILEDRNPKILKNPQKTNLTSFSYAE